MLKNNKGFTVVELIASFVFVSILSLSLFAIVINYNNKQKDEEIKAELLAFKSKLTIDIEQDIQRFGLKRIDYCDSSSIDTHSSCIELSFNNGTKKQLRKANRKCWEIYCDGVYQNPENAYGEAYCGIEPPRLCQDDEESSEYSYYDTYLSYGGIRYVPPDYKNVTIDSDYMLEYTLPSDGLENNLTLYKINIKLTHIDIDTDSDISIVAMGTEQVNEGNKPYEEYSIGDMVEVQLNSTDKRDFVVINNSGGYNGSVTLLYNDYTYVNGNIKKFSDLDINNRLPLPNQNVKFNDIIAFGNNFSGSKMETYFVGNEGLPAFWYNADKVRLITAGEVARVASIVINYRKVFDSATEAMENINQAGHTTPNWLKTVNYWTSTPVFLSESVNNNDSCLWTVNGYNGYFFGRDVTQEFVLRPVIEIDKVYVSRKG